MTAPCWDPDRADGTHAVLARLQHPADRAAAAALLDLPPDYEVARDCVGAITAPLLLAQLLDGSLSGDEAARLLLAAGAIRPGTGPTP